MKNMRVTTDRCVDFHSIKDVVRCVILPGMMSEEKAIACWRVIAENLYQYPWVYDVSQRPRVARRDQVAQRLRARTMRFAGARAGRVMAGSFWL